MYGRYQELDNRRLPARQSLLVSLVACENAGKAKLVDLHRPKKNEKHACMSMNEGRIKKLSS